MKASTAAGDRVIVNPVSGEHLIIRTSGSQTGDVLLAFDVFLPPGAHVPARHVHPIQSEWFTVVAGRMHIRLRRRTIHAGPGETVLVPAGCPHWFGNAGIDVAQAHVEVRPAVRMEQLLNASAAMAVSGGFIGMRVCWPGDLALLLSEFRHEIAVADVPAFLVQPVLRLLAWTARGRRSHAARRSGNGSVSGGVLQLMRCAWASVILGSTHAIRR